MSIQEQIACLEELSALDEEIRIVDEQLNQDRGSLAGTKEEIARLEERIAADDRSIAEMASARSDLVQEVRQVALQVDKSREKLSRSRNERESNAATRELEELRRIQKDREEEIGKLQMLETHALKSKEDAEAAHAELVKELESTEGATSKKLDSIEGDKAKMLKRRKEVIANLPRQIFSRYDMIRKRRGVGIAATSDGNCQACHLAVPPQLFQKILRNEKLEQCPHCLRILYYKPAPVDEAEKEASEK
ncbi:MAG: hypothetical protein CSA75_01215 [Sorangium cellulosum]|nr:MAG: hypothetical protein CSA75_01215 [Sorangium cellulosum]